MKRPGSTPPARRIGFQPLAAAAGLVLSLALFACATTLPAPSGGPGETVLLVAGATLHGNRLGLSLHGGFMFGREEATGAFSTGIGAHGYLGEPARVSLRHLETGRVLRPDRELNGYSFFVNVPQGTYRLEAAEFDSGDERDSDVTVPLSGYSVQFAVNGGGAWYLGTWRITFRPTGNVSLEPAAAGEEQENRAEVARLLAARGKGLWELR